MRIKIGSTLWLGEGSRYELMSPVQGLASPDIRVSDGLYAGRDGGFVSGHYYGHRTIVLQGFYIGANCEDAAELREVLFGLLRIRYKQPIIIYTASGNYYTQGVVSDVKSDLESLVAGKFQISLVCPDPILYKLENGTSALDVWHEIALSTSAVTTVSNSGNVDDYPILNIKGGFTELVLANNTTGKSMTLEMDNSASDSVIINMSKRVITKNDELANEYRTADSVWWSLLPGRNEIQVTATGASSLSVNLQYRIGRAGI